MNGFHFLDTQRLPTVPGVFRFPLIRMFNASGVVIVALLCALTMRAEEPPLDALTNSPAPANTNEAAESSTQLLGAVLLAQEQIRLLQREIETARAEAQAASKHEAELLAARLNLIEQTLTAERRREFDTIQSSIRLMLAIVGIVAAAGLVAVLFSGMVQMRTMARLSEMCRPPQLLPPGTDKGMRPQLTNGTHGPPMPGLVESSTHNLLSMIDRLQQRLNELEGAAVTTASVEAPQRPVARPGLASPSTLIAKGQSLLNLDKPAEALACFEEAISVDSRSVEAWIKKGTALERLQRIDEAIAAYDEAITADASTATAYLFKAGVFNRQKRYAEALECYELALNVQKARSTDGAAAAA